MFSFKDDCFCLFRLDCDFFFIPQVIYLHKLYFLYCFCIDYVNLLCFLLSFTKLPKLQNYYGLITMKNVWIQEKVFFSPLFLSIPSGKQLSGSMASSAISEYSSSSSPGFRRSTVLPSDRLMSSFCRQSEKQTKWQVSGLHWHSMSFFGQIGLLNMFTTNINLDISSKCCTDSSMYVSVKYSNSINIPSTFTVFTNFVYETGCQWLLFLKCLWVSGSVLVSVCVVRDTWGEPFWEAPASCFSLHYTHVHLHHLSEWGIAVKGPEKMPSPFRLWCGYPLKPNAPWWMYTKTLKSCVYTHTHTHGYTYTGWNAWETFRVTDLSLGLKGMIKSQCHDSIL